MALTPEEEQKKRTRDLDLAWVAGRVASAQGKRWFGKITIQVEDGVIKRVYEESCSLPPSAAVPR